MEEATSAQIEQLRRQAELLVELQTAEAQRLDSLSDLRGEVYRLRMRRKRLQQQLHAARMRLLAPTLSQRLARRHRATLAPDVPTTPVVRAGGELDRVAGAYRLAGKTLFPGLDDSVGVRLETFYRGKYYESYYVMLREQSQGMLAVYRHTLPAFVPVARLAQQLLNKDLDAFLDKVDDYVQAFVARRQQATELGDGVTVAADPAYAYVQLTSPRHVVHLVYDDLCSALPKRASVLPNDGTADATLHHVYSASAEPAERERQRDRAHEHLFVEHALPTAYQRLTGDA